MIFKYNMSMKIAIVKLSALGDIIHSAFVLQFIKQNNKDTRIDWIIEDTFAPVLEFNPHIDNIRKVNLKSLKNDFSKITKEIKNINSYARSNYDLVVDMQGLMKSAIVSRLLSNNIAGFDKNSIREKASSFFYTKKIDIPYHENTIDRYRVLVSQALKIAIDKNDILNKKPYLFYSENDAKSAKKFLTGKRKNVVFIIGSTWSSRIYPKEKLINIANNLDADIYIPFGNESEKEDASFIAKHAKNVTVLPKMNLNILKALISSVNLVIGNDTGPTYIAWANNIPSITLFGPTPPTRIYETDINKVLKSPSTVNPYKLNKDDFSISTIEEEEIVKIAKSLLKIKT